MRLRRRQPERYAGLRTLARDYVPKKVVLIVVDGMTPSAFERATESGRAPALAFLAANGDYRRGTSVFPSLTPVCLSSIATGAGPDVHHIPHLVWWHREERRIVEYGSSFSAIRAAGLTQSLADTIYNMNGEHLSRDATTVYEAVEEAGLVAAAVNITCYRGTTRYLPTLPWVTKPAYGPKRFFYYGLFESDHTGAPFAVRSRAAGSTDAYAAAVGRWLVTRDGFDFLAYYLSDYDYSSHVHGPAGADDVALERIDAAVQTLLDSAGGGDAFLERYAVVLVSDHGQTHVDRGAQLETAALTVRRHRRLCFEPRRTGVPASGRAHRRCDARPGASTASPRSTSRSGSTETTWSRGATGPTAAPTSSNTRTQPCGCARRWPTRTQASCSCPRRKAGSSPISAAATTPAAEATARSSPATPTVPLLTIGIDAPIGRITEITPAVLAHFGVGVTADAR